MNVITKLKDLHSEDFLLTVLALIFLISPGILTFFFFDRELFLTIDTTKLLFISVSIIIPFIFLNLALTILKFHNPGLSSTNKEDELFIYLLISLIITNFLFILSLGIGLLFSLNLINFLYMFGILHIALFIILYFL